MGLLDTLAAKNSATRTTSGRAAKQDDRPSAQVWANIGYEVNGKFVNLPMGMPIDTMEEVLVRGQDEEWLQLQTARNELLKAVQEAGDNLEPGQEIVLPLEIRIRRVNEQRVIEPGHNPFSMTNANLTIVK